MEKTWTPVRKKPVTVHVREATPEDEEMIRRREGEALVTLGHDSGEAHPHYMVMRGTEGEEYPISRAVFERTYERMS